MAIADITLLSGFSALRADLEKVRSAARGGGGPLVPPGAQLHPRSCPSRRTLSRAGPRATSLSPSVFPHSWPPSLTAM